MRRPLLPVPRIPLPTPVPRAPPPNPRPTHPPLPPTPHPYPSCNYYYIIIDLTYPPTPYPLCHKFVIIALTYLPTPVYYVINERSLTRYDFIPKC